MNITIDCFGRRTGLTRYFNSNGQTGILNILLKNMKAKW